MKYYILEYQDGAWNIVIHESGRPVRKIATGMDQADALDMTIRLNLAERDFERDRLLSQGAGAGEVAQ